MNKVSGSSTPYKTCAVAYSGSKQIAHIFFQSKLEE